MFTKEVSLPKSFLGYHAFSIAVVLFATLLFASHVFAKEPCVIAMPDDVYEFFEQIFQVYIEENLEEGSPLRYSASVMMNEGEPDALRHLREIPWPDLRCWTWAHLHGQDGTKYEGWVRAGDYGEVATLLFSNFVVSARLPDDVISEIQPAEFEPYLRRFVDDMENKTFARKPVLEDIMKGYPFGKFGCSEVVHHAYAAAVMNLWGDAERLLRYTFKEICMPFKRTYSLGAWQLFYHGIRFLEEGLPRAEVLELWQRSLDEFPHSHYVDEFRELSDVLRDQLDEEKKTDEHYEYLSFDDKIAYATARFIDVHGVQISEPGECRTIGHGEGTRWSDAIVEIGEAAIPTLIGLLTDRRLTRSVGQRRSLDHRRILLRVQDVAIQCIEAILGVQFYKSVTTSSYFSVEKPELQGRIISEIKRYWSEKTPGSEPLQRTNQM